MSIRVYVAGPYSSDPEGNVEIAIDAGTELSLLGFTPYIPHLTHFWHLRHPKKWIDWISYDLIWLPFCSAVLLLPGPSEGARRECMEARNKGIPVFTNIQSLRDAFFGTT